MHPEVLILPLRWRWPTFGSAQPVTQCLGVLLPCTWEEWYRCWFGLQAELTWILSFLLNALWFIISGRIPYQVHEESFVRGKLRLFDQRCALGNMRALPSLLQLVSVKADSTALSAGIDWKETSKHFFFSLILLPLSLSAMSVLLNKA